MKVIGRAFIGDNGSHDENITGEPDTEWGHASHESEMLARTRRYAWLAMRVLKPSAAIMSTH